MSQGRWSHGWFLGKVKGRSLLTEILMFVNSQQRRRLRTLLILSVVLSAADVLGVLLVVAVVARLGEDAESLPFGSLLKVFNPVPASVLVTVAFGLLVLKSFSSVLIRWKTIRLVQNAAEQNANLILGNFMALPKRFKSSTESAALVRTITVANEHFFNYSFMGLAIVASEGILLTFFVFLLISGLGIVGVGALVVFLASSFFYARVVQPRLIRATEDVQTVYSENVRMVNEAFRSVDEARVRGTSPFFLRRFAAVRSDLAIAQARFYFLAEMPRFYLETVFLVSMAITFFLHYVMFGSAGLAGMAVLLLGVGFRAIPSFSRVLGGVTLMRTGAVSLRLMSEIESPEIRQSGENKCRGESALNSSDAFTAGPRDSQWSICMDKVSFSYPQTNILCIREASARIQAGTICAFLGESGSGKSTLLDLLSGLVAPDSGVITVNGISVEDDTFHERRIVSLVPQFPSFLSSSIEENVCFGLPFDDDRLTSALREAQVLDFVNGLPGGVQTVLRESGSNLSGGQLQRIAIARALYGNPEVLLLDEPTSALDQHTEQQFMDFLVGMAGSLTVVIVTHSGGVASRCDAVYRLVGGRLVLESGKGSSSASSD